jgi:hypothetical protein
VNFHANGFGWRFVSSSYSRLKVSLKDQKEASEEELHGFGPDLRPLARIAKKASSNDKDIQALP